MTDVVERLRFLVLLALPLTGSCSHGCEGISVSDLHSVWMLGGWPPLPRGVASVPLLRPIEDHTETGRSASGAMLKIVVVCPPLAYSQLATLPETWLIHCFGGGQATSKEVRGHWSSVASATLPSPSTNQ